MNFVLPPWLSASQPAGFLATLAVFLLWTPPVLRADGIKPVRNGSAKNSAQAEALATAVHRPRTDVAAPPRGVREGQLLSPLVGGGIGVTSAGAVRGSGAGIPLDEPINKIGRPGVTSPGAGMAVSPAPNQEAHRV